MIRRQVRQVAQAGLAVGIVAHRATGDQRAGDGAQQAGAAQACPERSRRMVGVEPVHFLGDPIVNPHCYTLRTKVVIAPRGVAHHLVMRADHRDPGAVGIDGQDAVPIAIVNEPGHAQRLGVGHHYESILHVKGLGVAPAAVRPANKVRRGRRSASPCCRLWHCRMASVGSYWNDQPLESEVTAWTWSSSS